MSSISQQKNRSSSSHEASNNFRGSTKLVSQLEIITSKNQSTKNGSTSFNAGGGNLQQYLEQKNVQNMNTSFTPSLPYIYNGNSQISNNHELNQLSNTQQTLGNEATSNNVITSYNYLNGSMNKYQNSNSSSGQYHHQKNKSDLAQKFLQNQKKFENEQLLNTSQENLFVEKKIKLLESNARYFESQAHPLFVENSQLKDQLIEINELIRERTKDYSGLVRDFNEKGESREIVKKIGDLEAIYFCIKEDLGFLDTNVKTLKEDKRSLEQKVKDLENTLSENKRMHAIEIEKIKVEHQAVVNGLSDTIKNQQNVIVRLQQDLENEKALKERLIEQKNNEIKLLNSQLVEWQEKYKKMDNEYKKQLEGLEQIIVNLKEKHSKEKKELIEKYEMQIQNLKDSYENKIALLIADYETRIKLLQEELRQKNILIQDLKEQLETLRKTSSSEIEYLNARLSQALREIDNLKSKIDNLSAEMVALKKYQQELEKERDRLVDENNSLRDTVKKQNEDYIKLKEEKQLEILKLNKRIAELEQQLRDREDYWQKKLDDEIFAREQELRNRVNELTDHYENLLRNLRKELEDALKSLSSEKNQIIEELKQRVKQLEEENAILKSKLDGDNKEWSTRYKDLEDMMNRKIAELTKYYEDLLKAAERRRINDLDELERLRVKQLKDLEDKLNSEIQRIIEEKDRLFKEMSDKFQHHIQQLEQNWQSKYKEMEQLKNKKIQEMEDQHKKTIENMKKEHQRQLDELRNYYEEQIRKLKAQLENNAKGVIDDLKQRHQQELDRLKNMYEDQIKKLNQEWEIKLQKTIDEYEQRIKNLMNQMEQERLKYQQLLQQMEQKYQQLLQQMEDMKQKYELEISSLKQDIQNLKNEINNLKQKISDLEARIRELEEKYRKLKQEYQEFQRMHQREIEKLEQEKQQIIQNYEDREKKLKEKLESLLNDQLREHLEFVEKMKKDFEELIKAHKLKSEELRGEYRELERLFNERPSRPDDIRQIKLLLKEIENYKKCLSEAEIKVLHANEIVKYLQLELENYKNVYDIFGPGKGGNFEGNSAIQDSPLIRNMNIQQYQNLVKNKQQPKPIQYKNEINLNLESPERRAKHNSQGEIQIENENNNLSRSQVTNKYAKYSLHRAQTMFQNPLENDDIMKNAERFIEQLQDGQNNDKKSIQTKTPSPQKKGGVESNSSLVFSNTLRRRISQQPRQSSQQSLSRLNESFLSEGEENGISSNNHLQSNLESKQATQTLSNIILDQNQKQIMQHKRYSRNRIQQSQILDATINGKLGKGLSQENIVVDLQNLNKSQL
ncbi:hypothetical protein ABPG74_009594 [Tetrahymena malaccensis]